MKEFFMELVSGQGIWTALSISLIFYIIKKEENRDQKQEQREAKYQEIIDGLSTKLNVVMEVKDILQKLSDRVT